MVGADPHTPLQAGLEAVVICIGRLGWRSSVLVSHSTLPPALFRVGGSPLLRINGSEFALKLLVGVGWVYFCQRCGPKEVIGREFYEICAAPPFETSIFLYMSRSITFMTVAYGYNL